MPKYKFRKTLRRENSTFEEYEYHLRHQALEMDVIDILKLIDVDFQEKYAATWGKYTKYLFGERDVHPSKSTYPGISKLQIIGGDPEIREELEEFEDKTREKYTEFLNGLEGAGLHFKNYFKLAGTHLYHDYNYTEAIHKTPVYAALVVLVGCGPLLEKTGNPPTVDFHKIEMELREPDGKGYFEPYMALCETGYKMWDLEEKRQKLEADGYPSNETEEFKKNYAETLKDFITKFGEFKDVVREHHDSWKMFEQLQNDPDELTGNFDKSNRDINAIVGHMKGQVRALENGWPLEEIQVLGFVGETQATLEKKGLLFDEKNHPLNIRESEQKLTEYNAELARLTAEKAALDQNPQAEKNAKDELAGKIKGLQDKVVLEEARLLKASVWDKKITGANDKREVLASIDRFIANTKDRDIDSIRTRKNVLDEFRNKLNVGYGDEIKNNEFAKTKIQNHLDIYGPNPKYDERWATKNVISRDDFNEYIKPIDMTGQPFSEMEMAFLGMGASLQAREEIVAAYQDTLENELTYEELVLKNNNVWTEDLSSKTWGPREDLTTYKGIIKKGRELAVEAMNSYKNKDYKPMARIIYDSLYNTQLAVYLGGTFTNNPPYYYATFSTMMGLLSANPELLDEFDRYNNLQPKDKQVDLDDIRKLQMMCKTNMDSIDAKRKLENAEQIYNENVQDLDAMINNPAFKTLPKDDPSWLEHDSALSEKLSYEETVERYKLHTLRHVIMNSTHRYFEVYKKSLPGFVDIYNKTNKDMEEDPTKMGRATYELQEYSVNHSAFNPYSLHLGRAEGIKELDAFTDYLIDKYNLDLSPDRSSFVVDGKPVNGESKIDYEFQKFMLRSVNKELLLRAKEKELSEEELQDIAAQYIINAHQIKELNSALKTGILRGLANKNGMYYDANRQKNEAYINNVKEYVKNMDLSSMSMDEFAELFTTGGEHLEEIAKGCEALADIELAPDMADREQRQFTDITTAAAALKKAEKGVYGGTQEFTDIWKDMQKLGVKLNKASQDYINKGIYDPTEFLKEEKELLERMDKYINRKKAEREAGDDRTNSAMRLEAMESAKRTLKKRFEQDLTAPRITKDLKQDAKNVKNLINPADVRDKVSKRDNVAGYSGKECLDVAMDQTKADLIRYASKLTPENMSRNVKPPEFNKLLVHARDFLYLHTLRAALGPVQGDTPEQIKFKDNMIKKKLASGMDDRTVKTMNKFISTSFGKRYIDNITKIATEPGKNLEEEFTEEKMAVIRDKALREVYNFEKKHNPKKGVPEILNIAESLGSHELDREANLYKEAVWAHHKNNQEPKKVEEKKAAPKKEAPKLNSNH